MTTPIKVFLLDDHEVVRRGVAALLEAEADIVVVGEAGTADQAIARPADRCSTRAAPRGCCGASASGRRRTRSRP